jgi:Protein of unknown function (DUF2726)
LGHFYFLLGLGALAILAFSLSLARRLGRRHRLPYVAEQALFSPAERAFLSVLERAVGKGYRVYGKVPVADVLGVRPRIGRAARRRALERLGRLRFDFLVCTAETSAIACAVNLSPRSRLGRPPPKNGLDRICAAAGLAFVRFREGDRYSVVEVEERVFGAMHALRQRPKSSAPPREETEAALHHLSAAIADQGPPAEADRGVRAVHKVGGRPGPAPRTDRETAAPRSARKDPILAPVLTTDAEVDEGPRFQIDADLGPEGQPEGRPMRIGTP